MPKSKVKPYRTEMQRRVRRGRCVTFVDAGCHPVYLEQPRCLGTRFWEPAVINDLRRGLRSRCVWSRKRECAHASRICLHLMRDEQACVPFLSVDIVSGKTAAAARVTQLRCQHPQRHWLA